MILNIVIEADAAGMEVLGGKVSKILANHPLSSSGSLFRLIPAIEKPVPSQYPWRDNTLGNYLKTRREMAGLSLQQVQDSAARVRSGKAFGVHILESYEDQGKYPKEFRMIEALAEMYQGDETTVLNLVWKAYKEERNAT